MANYVQKNLERMPTLQVIIAQAALYEIGREDLAKKLGTNIKGKSTCPGGIFSTDRSEEDSHLIIRAMGVGRWGEARFHVDNVLVQAFEDYLERMGRT